MLFITIIFSLKSANFITDILKLHLGYYRLTKKTKLPCSVMLANGYNVEGNEQMKIHPFYDDD